MKKITSTLVVMAIILTGMFAATSFVAASSEAGSGQSRTITLSEPAWNYTNATVVVPRTISNATANVFTFTVVDTANVSYNYTFIVSIYDGNETWYNETVVIESVALNETEGNVTFAANSLPLLTGANITVIMADDTGLIELDSWYGPIDIVSATDYAMRITMIETLVSVLGVVLIVLVLSKVIGAMGSVKNKKGKK